jgi:hypothetical protein
MRSCRNCYYRSIIGFENWCCHPAIGKRIKNADKQCADHIYFDFKGQILETKLGYAEMIKNRVKPPERSYRLVHAGTGIMCKKCGLISFNCNDVEMKFCGNCKIYHEDNE